MQGKPILGSDFFARVDQLVDRLLETTSSLLTLFDAKRQAIRVSHVSQIERLSQIEAVLAEQLQKLWERREELVAEAQHHGFRANNLTAILVAARPAQMADLVGKLAKLRTQTGEVQHASWVQWILTNRCAQVYTEFLDRLANGGGSRPTYEDVSPVSEVGGALLNASA